MNSRKRKILIILPNDSWGGAEALFQKVVGELKGEDITVVHFRDKKISYWDEFKPFINQKYMSDTNERKGLIKYFFSVIFNPPKKYDFIFTSHVYITGMVGFLLWLGFLKSKYFVARESTSIFLRYSGFSLFAYKVAYYLGYRHMNLLICQTQKMKEQLVENFPRILKRTRVEVFANPISLEEFHRKGNQPIDADLPEDFIITAGRFIPEKGYDLLVAAFKKLIEIRPGLKLIILGTGRQMEETRGLIHEMGLSDDIILGGFALNVFPYFKRAKLCVISSRIEGFPNVLLEMMSQNDRVLTTLCAGGISEVPGITKIPANDEAALLQGMVETLDATNTDQRRQEMDKYLKDRDIKKYMSRIMRSL